MDKNSIEKRIKVLEKEREQYKYIIVKLDNVYLTESERINFIKENKTKIEQLNKLSKEIAELNWNLMTPLEQKDYLDKYSE